MRRLIVNIRGANAAGKTTLARQFHDPSTEGLLGEFAGVKVRCTVKEVPGLELPVMLVGTYDDSKYSGCDKIKSVEAIEGAIRAAAAGGDHHVLFEGFYVSKSWARYAALRNELTRADPNLTWLWAFIHAPEALIFERSEARRSPDSRPIDKKELAGVVRQMANSRRNAMELYPKQEVLTLDPTRAPEVLYRDLVQRMAELEAA